MRKLVFLRRISQVFFFSLFVYILWSTTYPLHGFILPERIFHFDPLVMSMVSVSARSLLPGIFLSVLIVIASAVFTRFFCGWVCPLGAMLDFFGKFHKKKKVLSDGSSAALRKIKFFVLAVILLLSLARVQTVWLFDPLVIAARFVSLNLIPAVTGAADNIFVFLIRTFGLYDSVLFEVYGSLKTHFLGVKAAYFDSALYIFAFFAAIAAISLFIPRFWCRFLCPLGAIYALIGKTGLLERETRGCTTCGVCAKNCRMGAIKEDMSYVKSECVLCMDCVYDCPVAGTRFCFSAPIRSVADGSVAQKDNSHPKKGLSRKQFLFVLSGALATIGFKLKAPFGKEKLFVRPPGAVNEDQFSHRCIRCGNCMKVCPTNVIQPVFFQGSIHDIWTPHLLADIGYCEYNCKLCTEVCPTGAIEKITLRKKQNTKIASSKVDRSICLAWENKQNCLVCEEHCPVPTKAIKIVEENVNGIMLKKPVVDNDLCIGCGICQNKCPVRPKRAIRIYPV